MDPAIAIRYQEHILAQARQRFEIDASSIELLDGFEAENPFAPTWTQQIPTFMKLRAIELFAILQHLHGARNLNAGSWDARVMRARTSVKMESRGLV
jgi:Ser/Thr protein kinase RdoA (MazF antagonist)